MRNYHILCKMFELFGLRQNFTLFLCHVQHALMTPFNNQTMKSIV